MTKKAIRSIREAQETVLGKSERLLLASLDALSAHIAILDQAGFIIAVNRAWREFAQANHAPPTNVCEGASYLNVCDTARGPDAEQAVAFAAALNDVMRGKKNSFAMEYPCHSPEEQRWFNVQVTHFSGNGSLYVVVTHENITARKRTEEKLREASNYARSLIEASLDPLITIDVAGKIMDVNAATEEATGLKREQLIGSAFADYFTEPDKARAGYAEVFAKGSVTDYPLTLHHASGGRMDVLFNASVYRDEPGNIVGVLAAARDITERKKAEEALNRSRTELKTIYENAPVMMCVLDASRQVRYANRAFAELTGRPVEEIAMERACGVIGCLRALDDPRGCGHGPDCEICAVRLAMVDALATGRSYQGIEYRTMALYRSQPRESVFLASIAPIQISGQSDLLLCLQDITERYRAEEELRRSEERYRLLVATSMDAVLLTAPDGRIFAANAAACRMFNRSERELIQVGRKGVADDSDPRWAPALEERARTGRFRGDLTLIRADGSKFPGEISSAVFRDPVGEVRSSMVIRDISERRRAGEELRASREQLRALAAHLQKVREEERSHLAREIHDVLAQDLTRLKIDLVRLEHQLTESGKAVAPEALAARVSEMKRIADVSIQCVQNLATGLRPHVLDSFGLCAAVEWQIRDFRDRTGMDCHTSVPEEEFVMDRDVATAAFRILQESLTNILRHAHATHVDVLLQPKGNHFTLRVKDNGCGIPPGAVDNPLSIGLSGMRERVRLQDGTFKIRSVPGSGTTIEARLPLGKKEQLPKG